MCGKQLPSVCAVVGHSGATQHSTTGTVWSEDTVQLMLTLHKYHMLL